MSARELITEHMDLWTWAVTKKSSSGRGNNGKVELTGVKKLRELILELAVRGHLSDQLSSDEPADKLLEAILPEVKQLIQDGRFKVPKEAQTEPGATVPFGIPKTWTWCSLDQIAAIARGGSPRPIKSFITTAANGLNWIKIGDATKGSRLITKAAEKIIPEGLHKTRIVYPGDLILSNSMSFGQPYILDIEGCIHDGWLLLRTPESLLDKVFLYYLLLSPYAMNAFTDSAAGAVVQNLNADKVRLLSVPLPPLEEQHRIVQKVDELMALCDRLEQETNDQFEAHETLVDTLLDTLTQSENATELADNWARLAAHFDTLFTTEQSIDKLKQTILQLAVMGKLISHVPNDEPARNLLQKMALEKDQLTKKKKIKKQRVLPPISAREKPFELPQDWEWCRFQELIYDLKYGTSKKSDYSIQGTPILRIPNVVKGYIDSNDLKFSKLTEQELEDLSLKENDILVIRSNGSSHIVGTTTVVDESHEGFAYAGYLVRIRTNTEVCDPNFLQYAFQSYLIRNQIEQPLRTTSGVKNINSTEISSLVLPLPPLEAQQRIVATIQNVMDICEQLKERLNQASETRCQLAEAMVEGALN